MRHSTKLVICLLVLQCTGLRASPWGTTDSPNPWGTFPKHFTIGKTHSKIGFSQNRVSGNYIENLIEQWNSDPELVKIITYSSGCVFGDIADEDPEKDCPGVYPGGWYNSNNKNEVYFNTWPTEIIWQEFLGLTRPRSQGTPLTKESDVFINPSYRWTTQKELYSCELLSLEFYLFDALLLHEVGHAIGLGHEGADYSLMAPKQGFCLPDIDDWSTLNPLIKPIDFLRLKSLYPQRVDQPRTMDLYVQGLEEGQHLSFGQSYTFSAAPSATFAYSSSTEGLVTNKSLAKTNATGSTLNWQWFSNVDANIGIGETIMVNDLSVGWHSIKVTASNDDGSEYGESIVSVKVVSNGFYGEDSTTFFPSPCVRSVANPSEGCLLSFSGGVVYPNSGGTQGCGWYTPSFTVQNRDTGATLPTTKYLDSSLVCTQQSSDTYAWYFWLEDPDDEALIGGTYQVRSPLCGGAVSDLCFSSTYSALIPIKSTSIQLDSMPTSCELSRGATHCSVDISWSNGKYNAHAGLFYRENAQSPWVFVENTNFPSGSVTTPEIVAENGVEFAIFQYAEAPFGNPFVTLPSGQMTETFVVHGRPAIDPEFMGETVFPFATGAPQDIDTGFWNVHDNGTTLNLYGNTWKAINFNYDVTENTWLEFDYKSKGVDEPEIAGVALLLSPSDITSNNGPVESTFQIDGTQSTLSNQWFHRYLNNGWKTYRINVGHVMKDLPSFPQTVNYLGFLGDADLPNKNQIDISYRNPRLYEKPTRHLPHWGHSGNWYDAETSGQGFTLEVNPISEVVALEWYTYTENGHGLGASHNRWYMKSGPYDPNSNSQDTVDLTIYQPTGGRFNLSNAVTNNIVGTAKIRFFDCLTAHVEYDFYTGSNSGRHGFIPITRLTPNIDCPINEYSGPHKNDFGLTGNWYNPPTSGQGFFFELNPVLGVFAAEWFTFLPGNSSNLHNPNRQRWFTMSGGYTPGNPNSNTLTIYQHKGGALDDPNSVTTQAVGTANVVFTSCIQAVINYNFTGANEFAGLSGTIDLFRVAANYSCDFIPAPGSNETIQVSQTPWGSNADTPDVINASWDYALGYHFTPEVDGLVTKLGGYFNGTKTVRLFNNTTGAILATTTVASSNNWSYSSISPVAVVAGSTYTVAAYMAGSGGTTKLLNMQGYFFPRTYGDITIESSTYTPTDSNPSARPINSITTHMYGQVDIEFTPN